MGCLKLTYQKQEKTPLRVIYRKPKTRTAEEIPAVTETRYRYRKHYATIFPAEIKINEDTGATLITQYLGGDAYTAPVIKQNNQYRYLHRDHLGSILAITDDLSRILEKRHFGAWGMVESFTKNGQEVDFSETLLNRGFTGHEHFEEVDAIQMPAPSEAAGNGRMYNPRLHRFVSPDNFIQDPYNTMSYDRQGYVWNNPLMNSDPTGELIWFAVLMGAWMGVANAIMNDGNILLGALIGGVAGFLGAGVGNLALGGTFFGCWGYFCYRFCSRLCGRLCWWFCGRLCGGNPQRSRRRAKHRRSLRRWLACRHNGWGAGGAGFRHWCGG